MPAYLINYNCCLEYACIRQLIFLNVTNCIKNTYKNI